MTDLNFGLLVNGFLLLGAVSLLLLDLVGNVHSDAELVSQLVNTDPLRANNSTNIFPIDLKLCELNIADVNKKLQSRGWIHLRSCWQ